MGGISKQLCEEEGREVLRTCRAREKREREDDGVVRTCGTCEREAVKVLCIGIFGSIIVIIIRVYLACSSIWDYSDTLYACQKVDLSACFRLLEKAVLVFASDF